MVESLDSEKFPKVFALVVTEDNNVDRATFASFMGTSTHQVDQCVRQGMPHIQDRKGGSVRIPFGRAKSWYERRFLRPE